MLKLNFAPPSPVIGRITVLATALDFLPVNQLIGALITKPFSKEPSPKVENNVVADNNSSDTQIIDEDNFTVIKAPLVGTFYLSPKPGEPQYVNVGDKISVGSILCIVEAMKLMNEIESEVAGTVVEILANNSDPVQFGQVLFRIDPA